MTVLPPIIAIDGTVASGKGTLARKLAQHLNFAHLDTGKIYRAVGFAVLEQAGDAVANLIDSDLETTALTHAQNLTPEQLANPILTHDHMGQMASRVAQFDSVRNALLKFQQNFATNPPAPHGGAVLDGRDIGTVICPHAPLKLFVTADDTVRAERRYNELTNNGITTDYDTVLADLRERDNRDTNRKIAPLKPTAESVLIDTTTMTAQQVLDTAINHAESVFGTPQ